MRLHCFAVAVLGLSPACHVVQAVPTDSSDLLDASLDQRWFSERVESDSPAQKTHREPEYAKGRKWRDPSESTTLHLEPRGVAASKAIDDSIQNMRKTLWYDSVLVPVAPLPVNTVASPFVLSTKKNSEGASTTHLMPFSIPPEATYQLVFYYAVTPMVIKLSSGPINDRELSALAYPHFESKAARISFQARKDTEVWAEIQWPTIGRRMVIEMKLYGPRRR